MSACLFGLGVVFVFIGLVELLGKRPVVAPTEMRRPTPPRRSQVSQPLSRPASQAEQGVTVNLPQTWNHFEPGDRVRVLHPADGELILHIQGRVTYAELWQQGRGAQVPWTPTGNSFYGFWLETNRFLVNWLNRCYLFDEMVPTTDVEIQRDFAPYARQFAQSDQTAVVHFSYPPAVWKIDDIGKFRIEKMDGSAVLAIRVGAVGRFIHASGDSKRALAVEDYEGGSGQDVVWIGYQISAEDVQKE